MSIQMLYGRVHQQYLKLTNHLHKPAPTPPIISINLDLSGFASKPKKPGFSGVLGGVMSIVAKTRFLATPKSKKPGFSGFLGGVIPIS